MGAWYDGNAVMLVAFHEMDTNTVFPTLFTKTILGVEFMFPLIEKYKYSVGLI